MKVDSHDKGGVTVVDLKGKFTIGSGDAAIREAIQKCVAEGKLHILLNTAGVSTIDSSGVGELVAGFTTVTNRGGKLKLLNLPPKLEDILQVTQLITVFDVYEDEATALASFAS
jgi:anti-sigma B factor antagonist